MFFMKSKIQMALAFVMSSKKHQNDIVRVVNVMMRSQTMPDLGTVPGATGYYEQFKVMGEL